MRPALPCLFTLGLWPVAGSFLSSFKQVFACVCVYMCMCGSARKDSCWLNGHFRQSVLTWLTMHKKLNCQLAFMLHDLLVEFIQTSVNVFGHTCNWWYHAHQGHFLRKQKYTFLLFVFSSHMTKDDHCCPIVGIWLQSLLSFVSDHWCCLWHCLTGAKISCGPTPKVFNKA